MKIFVIRKKGSDQYRVVQSETIYRAMFTTGWKEEECDLMGKHTVKGYLKDEVMFNGIYKNEAKKRKEQGR